MRYILDNDLHIHSQISACSGDAEQTTDRILKYALDNGLKTICITDHFWDSDVVGASSWYAPQNFDRISGALPLPCAEGVRFLFGCETELTKDLVIGISPKRFDSFDFVIIPTTHFHMKGYTLTDGENESNESRANAWVKRLGAVLDMELPFHKIGIAHLTCGLIDRNRGDYLKTLELLPHDDMKRLFTKAAGLGVGIELNSLDMSFEMSEAETVLRPYRIALDCGCKFYCGSDAHHPDTLEKAGARFERAIDMLGLTEEDKFII